MTPTPKYITTVNGIDIAIGFENIQDIKQYMASSNELAYDYMLVDLDRPENYVNFEFKPGDIHFFVTSFDVYSIQRGISVLREIKEPTEIMKVIFTRDPNAEESEYLDLSTLSYKINWKDDVVYFPFETADLYEIFQNQRFSRIKFSNLSNDYLEALSYFLENLSRMFKWRCKKSNENNRKSRLK